jgi:virginiamycin B lyase
VGSDGAFWFEEGTANKIGRITSSGQVTNEYSIPTPNSGAHAITAGPDGQIWFSEIFANKIASIATH